MPITIPTVSYDGTNPDPVEWANDSVKPAIEGLDTRLIDVEGGLPGSVMFTATMDGGAGALGGGAFTTWPLHVASVNIGGGSLNTSTYIYTVPMDGLYMCFGGVRIGDGDTVRSFAIGIGTSNADAPHVLWGPLGGSQRNGRQYARLAPFYEGDQVRLYIYSDGANVTPINSGWGNFMTLIRMGPIYA